jgi:Rieske Fe-S protein
MPIKRRNNAKKSNRPKNKPHRPRKRAPKTNKKKHKCFSGMSPIKTPDGIICVGKCPHSGGPIYYNPATDKFICKWHGSQFTRKGKVLTPPAMSNLQIKKPKN